MSFHEKTTVAARGKWKGILMELGVPESFLSKRPRDHGPCPICGGVDRFRYDDKDGAGTFFCNQHGAGDGMMLAMQHTGLGFADCAARVDEIIRNVKPDSVPRKPEITEEDRRRMLKALWTEAKPLTEGDLVTRYLGSRGLIAETPELRFASAVRDGEGGIRPAMIARVLTPDGGRVATLHRTFLRPDGLAKAEMQSPRKLAPGSVPEGSAIRLGPVADALGVAEGIETALAASVLFELPVWATVSSAMMEKWTPPAGVSEVCIFADNDAAFGGQAAAYSLAHRLKRDFDVTVRVPPMAGTDWNDVLLSDRNRKSA
jgi:putative DNA primase/helicase